METNFKVEDITPRLKEIMEHYGVRVMHLFPTSATDQVVLGRVMNGKYNPSTKVILSFVDLFPNVSLDWIMTGRGEMLIDPNNDTCNVNYVPKRQASVNTKFHELLKRLEALEEENKKLKEEMKK